MIFSWSDPWKNMNIFSNNGCFFCMPTFSTNITCVIDRILTDILIFPCCWYYLLLKYNWMRYSLFTSINKKLWKILYVSCSMSCPVLSCPDQDNRTSHCFSSCPVRPAGRVSRCGRQDRTKKVVLCSSLLSTDVRWIIRFVFLWLNSLMYASFVLERFLHSCIVASV